MINGWVENDAFSIILGDFWIVKVYSLITSFDNYQMQARAVTPLSEKRPFFDVPDDASAEKHRAWAEQLWCRMDRDRSGTVTREELMCDWYGIYLEGFVFLFSNWLLFISGYIMILL